MPRFNFNFSGGTPYQYAGAGQFGGLGGAAHQCGGAARFTGWGGTVSPFNGTTNCSSSATAVLNGGAGDDIINVSPSFRPMTINGNAGNDTLTGSSTVGGILDGGDGNDILTGGAGADTLIGGNGDDTISTGAGLDVVTGGAGADKFVLASNTNGSTYSTITDFTGDPGGDTIDLSGLTGGATLANISLGAALTPAANATFTDYLNAAAAGHGAAATNAVTSWFQYGGDSYIVVDNNNADVFVGSTVGGDQVVKLTGLMDLGLATLSTSDLLVLA